MNDIQLLSRTGPCPAMAAVLALALFSGAATAAEPMRLADASAAFAQWIKAYEMRDAEKLMSIFDKTLIYSAQGEGDQKFDELKTSYQGYFASRMPPTRWKAVPKEIFAQGDLTVVISIWEQRERTPSGVGELIQRTRSVDVFRRTPKGWKIVRTISYPEPN
jgi:ketosteroid isomerase-like protein